jgi:hypothetical protein
VTKEEFASLPLQTALGLVYDMAAAKLSPLPRPPVPRPPKYDDRMSRKKGFFVWVSEMTLDDLVWWENKKRESAASDSPYAEKDGKLADKLAKWIEWRRLFPTEVWSGTRGDDRATAAPPSRDPKLNAWGERTNKPNGAPPPEPEPEEEKYDF